MELLAVHHLTTYQRGEALFQPLDLRLAEGMRIGLTGPNGAGKSTLLQLLAGSRAPDEGRVARPPGVRVAYLPQRLDEQPSGTVWQVAATGLRAVQEAEARLRAEERRLAAGEPREAALALASETFESLGGYRAEADLRTVLTAVGLPEAWWDRPAAGLSGGERRRLALASALSGDPEVLLLDEPTNHLDLRMRAWLAQRLASWHGAVVLVSHDRMLLDRATHTTLFLQGGVWELRRGSYGRARRARERDLLALRKRDAERAKEAARLAAMAEQLARRHNRGAARRRHVAERRLDALHRTPDAPPRTDGSPTDVRLRGGRLQGWLLEARALRREGVVEVAHVILRAGQRIALLGPNGSGKSTLLALLAGELASDDPRSELHYPPGLRLELVGQLDRGLADGVGVVDQVAAWVGDAPARQLLARAGVGADRWNEPPERLSGGERARAGLARLEARRADLILLDEPGNDLDLDAVEALESALRESPAAFVLATHDRRLVETLAEEVWAVEDGVLRRYPDTDAYLAGDGGIPVGVELPVGAPDEASARRREDAREEAQGSVQSGPRDAAAPWNAAVTSIGTDRRTHPRDVPRTDAHAAGRTGAQRAGSVAEALEDERGAIDRLLEDPLQLAPRELERLTARRADLEDRLAPAYDALLEPPAPRFRVRERGLEVVADRLGQDLLVMAVPEAEAPRAMDALLRRESGDDGTIGGAHPVWPWARVHSSAGVAHLAVHDPPDTCVLPWARAALVDAAARFTFTLLDVSALQLFCRDPLPDTCLEPAGEGWWSWTRTGFMRREGLPEGPAPHARPQRRSRGAPASRRA